MSACSCAHKDLNRTSGIFWEGQKGVDGEDQRPQGLDGFQQELSAGCPVRQQH